MPNDHEERIAALEAEVAALRRIVNGVSPGTAPKKKRAAQLPDGWEPQRTEVAKLVASYPNVDIPHETDCFRDYWTSKGEARADWDATYRNWIRRAAQYGKPAPIRVRPPTRTAAVGEANGQRVEGALARLAQVRAKAGS